jgi:HEAT repeat protein
MKPVYWLFPGLGISNRLASEDERVRAETVELCLKRPARARAKRALQERVFQALKQDPEPRVRHALAFRVMASDLNMGVRLGLMAELLRDPEPRVRQGVMLGLGGAECLKGTVLPVALLETGAADPHPSVRALAVSAVQRLGLTPVLMEQLLRPLAADPHSSVRQMLAEVVAQSPEPLDATGRAILDTLCEDTNTSVRLAIVARLPHIKGVTPEEAMDWVERLESNSRPEVRYALAEPVSHLPDRVSGPKLRRYALNLDYNLREHANRHVGNLKDERVKAAILDLAVRDPQPSVRRAALETAQRSLQDPELKQPLVAALTQSLQ